MALREYITKEDYSFGPISKQQILHKNSFVQPISTRWVPKHTQESSTNHWHNEATDTFCYTHYGIISLPDKLIMKIDW